MTDQSYRVYFAVFGVFFTSQVHSGNIRYFVTDICGQEVGPDFGTYLEFDKDGILATNGKFAPPGLIGKLLQCTVTVRGMPPSGEKRYMSVYWRNFRFKGPEIETVEKDPAKCGKAYVTLYKGKGTNVAEKETFCGRGALPTHIEWEGEYATFFFYVDYRTPSPPDPDDPTNYTYSEIFFRLDITSFDYECKETKEGISMLCNDSKRCLDDSLRCDFWYSRNCQSQSYPRDNSDTSRWPPGNCYKIAKTTTTTPSPPPPPTPPDFTPLIAVLAAAFAFAFFFWCFWRPGYILWRAGRLRNNPCMRACGTCIPCSVMCMRCCSCSSCCVGGYESSPTGAAAWRALQLEESERQKSFVKEGTSFIGLPSGSSQRDSEKSTSKILPCFPKRPKPEKQGGKVRLRQATVCPLQCTPDDQMFSNIEDHETSNQDRSISNNPGKKTPSDINFATDWVKLLTSDGCHLREHR